MLLQNLFERDYVGQDWNTYMCENDQWALILFIVNRLKDMPFNHEYWPTLHTKICKTFTIDIIQICVKLTTVTQICVSWRYDHIAPPYTCFPNSFHVNTGAIKPRPSVVVLTSVRIVRILLHGYKTSATFVLKF